MKLFLVTFFTPQCVTFALLFKSNHCGSWWSILCQYVHIVHIVHIVHPPCKSLQLIMIATKCTKGATDALLFHNFTAVQFYDEKCSAMRCYALQCKEMQSLQCNATTDALLFHNFIVVQFYDEQCSCSDMMQCTMWYNSSPTPPYSAITRWSSAIVLRWNALPGTMQCNAKIDSLAVHYFNCYTAYHLKCIAQCKLPHCIVM